MNEYIQAMEYFAENNISLSNQELSDLKTRLLFSRYEESASVDDIFDMILESYDFDSDDEADYYSLQEGANLDIRRIFKDLKKEYNKQCKEYKENCKNLKLNAAKKNLQNMLDIVNKSEKEIRAIDASKLGSVLSGYLLQYTIDIARSLVALSSAEILGSVVKKYVKKNVSVDTSGLKGVVPDDYAKEDLDVSDIVGAATTMAAQLVNDIDLLIQKRNDKKLAQKENDLRGYMSTKNNYRERILIVLKDMKKQIAKQSLQLDTIIHLLKKENIKVR